MIFHTGQGQGFGLLWVSAKHEVHPGVYIIKLFYFVSDAMKKYDEVSASISCWVKYFWVIPVTVTPLKPSITHKCLAKMETHAKDKHSTHLSIAEENNSIILELVKVI